MCLSSPGEMAYYFAVKAVDTDGRTARGDVSTIAMASLKDLPNNARKLTGLSGIIAVWLVLALVKFTLALRGQDTATLLI